MSDTADSLTSKETQGAPGYDVSSPPPPLSYSSEGQPPPPYSATPELYHPAKIEPTGTDQPPAGCESCDVSPEALSDATPPIAPSPYDDKTVRRAFIRKVFSILTIQLLFTFSVVCIFTFSSVVKEAVQSSIWAYVSSFIIFIVVASALSCCKSFSRRHPWNIVGLAVVTLSLSYMVGTVASFHDTSAVIITMGTTMAITVAIIAFSAQTRYDFTVCNGFLLVMAVVVIMFGFFSIFYYSYIADVAYGSLGALLFSLFLMIDCQLIMGRASYSLDPEEYIYAALIVYLDIVLIFLYLLGRR